MNFIRTSLKGLCFGAVFFFVFSVVGAMLLKFTPFPEEWGYGYCIFMISILCFSLSLIFSLRIQQAGALCGVLTSISVIFLIIFLTSITLKEPLEFHNYMRPSYGIPVLLGILGGILGVNVKK